MDNRNRIDAALLANNLDHYISSYVYKEILTTFKQIPIHFNHDGLANHLMILLPGNAFDHRYVSFSTMARGVVNGNDWWYCMGKMPKNSTGTYKNLQKYTVVQPNTHPDEPAISYIKGPNYNPTSGPTYVGIAMGRRYPAALPAPFNRILTLLANDRDCKPLLELHYSRLVEMVSSNTKKTKLKNLTPTWTEKQEDFQNELMDIDPVTDDDDDTEYVTPDISQAVSRQNPAANISQKFIDATITFFQHGFGMNYIDADSQNNLSDVPKYWTKVLDLPTARVKSVKL